MVLMGQGCAEQGHDAIAHDLIDRALIAVHGRHHALQHGIEELPRVLGVTLSEQLIGGEGLRACVRQAYEEGDGTGVTSTRTRRSACFPCSSPISGCFAAQQEQFAGLCELLSVPAELSSWNACEQAELIL